MPDDFDFDPKRRFYRNKNVNKEYERRVEIYRDEIKKEYPHLWNPSLHMPQIREMVQSELELELITRQIGNDGFVSSAWMEKMRKSVRDAVFRYRYDLMITPRMMAKMKKEVEKEEGDPLEALLVGLPNKEYAP